MVLSETENCGFIELSEELLKIMLEFNPLGSE
jgi:hypothetical protein